jgi:hypothetical protein
MTCPFWALLMKADNFSLRVLTVTFSMISPHPLKKCTTKMYRIIQEKSSNTCQIYGG